MIIEFKKKTLFKSPTFFWDHGKIVISVFLALILTSFIFIDKPLALCFLAMSSQIKEFFLFIELLFSPTFWILVIPSLFFYMRFVLRQERKSRKFWFLSLSLPFSVFAVKILQFFIGRSDPSWLALHQEMTFRFFEWNPSFHAFPSISSCFITALATSLSCFFSKGRLSVVFGGMLLSLIPVISSNCFLSDALAGICLGLFSSLLVFKKMRKEISF